MQNTIAILQSLICQIWYLPLVVIVTFIVYSFTQSKINLNVAPVPQKTSIWWLGFLGFLVFVVFSAPYWMFGDNAAHGFADDIAHILQTYLSSSLRGDSINWTNGLAGGMDRWLLPNSYPYALGRIYALFLFKPYQLYLLVMVINVISVFIFSWKIQVEILLMRPWAAYIGAVITAFIEGYWTGVYPDAHVSNGHGFAVIIVGIYWLTRFCHHPKFWLVALFTGALMAIGSWTPFHNLPPLLITVGIWGLIFWGKEGWLKIIKANALIVIIFLLLLLPYFLAIKLLFSTTGRVAVFRPSVELDKIYLVPQMIFITAVMIVGALLGIYRQKLVRQVLWVFLAFSLLPLIAYALEISKIAPFFRWNLLFAGNEAWIWISVIFFIERIQQEIQNRWVIPGIASKVVIISMAWTVIMFGWMNSFWMDLISSYPEGTWKAYTDTSISSILKTLDPDPGRVIGIDDTHDTHFWGEYQGIEPYLVYTPFIDQRKTYFWWYSAMMNSLHGAYTAAWLSIPVPVVGHEHNYNFPVPLSALVNMDALKLTNVHWVVSHHPLYPMPELQLISAQEGQAACTPNYGPPSRIDFNYLNHFWKDIGCIIKDYGYQRPLYVYHLSGSLPRVFLANHILPWPAGQISVLSQPELRLAAQGSAFINLDEWKSHQTLSSAGSVYLDSYQSDYMRLRLHVDQDSLVVVATTLNPFWRVLVDGNKVDDIVVNGFQNGFWVKPGETEAELIYCPPFRPALPPRCSKKFL